MIIKINKKVGATQLQFEVEGSDVQSALLNACQFTTIPESCDLCGEENLMLDGMKAQTKEGKTVTYNHVKCLSCGAKSTAGVRMDDKNIFWKKFEKYEPNND